MLLIQKRGSNAKVTYFPEGCIIEVSAIYMLRIRLLRAEQKRRISNDLTSSGFKFIQVYYWIIPEKTQTSFHSTCKIYHPEGKSPLDVWGEKGDYNSTFLCGGGVAFSWNDSFGNLFDRCCCTIVCIFWCNHGCTILYGENHWYYLHREWNTWFNDTKINCIFKNIMWSVSIGGLG